MSEIKFPIYLDHHATTPLDPRVLDEMMPYLTEKFGNASSLDHPFGYEASVAVESARDKIAKAIGARHDEIIFTSGATESNNLALIGTMEKYKDKGDHLITCVTEHKAVLDTARHLESLGKKITYLPVNEYGEINLEQLEDSIKEKTVMISIMTANNEIGTIADVEKIGNIAHDHDVFFHTDAAQAVGHIPMNVEKMNIDLMSFSAHKMYGPKGIGALYVRGVKPRIKPNPILHGGGQERNIRSGTLNVPGIVGFGRAIELSQHEMKAENNRFHKWSVEMFESFFNAGGKQNGHPTKRLEHNLNVYFKGIESKSIINSISKEIAISAGSACTTQIVEPSHVLLSLGFAEERAHSSLRIGIGRNNTHAEIQYVTENIISCVKKLEKITL
ncbi:IscS subfamily cysteine desulfurase [Nitrosopumilus sp. b1]|uniref:cysteine desulfurase family protein n=1 Tax=Nitrosopumilus sp. b1 TaxID=2109907 RepID=UPI0015F4F148|nr:cysteine desulfurase family protein [Nitrosopumilus sp. b1]KAF6243628.1 IscS subfamily cysteine desulfurase [Nitrosopumilus sp. b1]